MHHSTTAHRSIVATTQTSQRIYTLRNAQRARTTGKQQRQTQHSTAHHNAPPHRTNITANAQHHETATFPARQPLQQHITARQRQHIKHTLGNTRQHGSGSAQHQSTTRQSYHRAQTHNSIRSIPNTLRKARAMERSNAHASKYITEQ